MSKEIRQEILDFLLKESRDHGLAVVKDACNLFLKTGIRLGVDPTEPRRFKPSQIKKAWQRQEGRCNRCHEPLALDQAVGDHVIPWSRGGRSDDYNCAAIHSWCNSEKRDNDLMTDSKRTGNLFNETLPAEE